MKASGVGMLADDPAVDGLIALGRRKGHLSFEDLRTGLPIASMSVAAIAAAVSRVEQAGILIDVGDAGFELSNEPASPSPGPPHASTEVRPQAQPAAVATPSRRAPAPSDPSRRVRAGVAGLAALAALSVAAAAGLLLL